MAARAIVATAVSFTALAATWGAAGASSYPPDTTTTTVAQEPPRSLDVTAFSPVCIGDAPFIQYDIKPIGFTPTSGNATLTFRDRNGRTVETRQVTSLQGRTIYPGASVAPDGTPTDWPGWKFENGVWVEDPTDAILRDGLTITVEVNPTATANVSYPPATAACASPERVAANPPPASSPLPRTGSDVADVMRVGALAVGVGLLAFVGTRRRRSAAAKA